MGITAPCKAHAPLSKILSMLETISTDVTANARIANLNGRAHLVAPMTLIVPGVLAGSMGPLLYPPDEVSRRPQIWNNIPMVVYHPTDKNGKHISANTPGVIEEHGVGEIKRSIWNGKHVAEGWFDLAKLDVIDKRLTAEGKPTLRNRLENGEKIELSTGLFTENEEKSGTFNGKPYTHVARNYRPDHLAILPDQPGACSVSDGCGVNNELITNANDAESSAAALQTAWEAISLITNEWSDAAREAALEARRASSAAHKATLRVALAKANGHEGAKAATKATEAHKVAAVAHDKAVLAHMRDAKKRGKVGSDEETAAYSKHTNAKEMHEKLSEHHRVNNQTANQGKHHETGQFLNKKGVSAKQIQKHAEKGGGLTKTPPTPEKESDKYKAFAATARQAGYTEMADAWDKMASECDDDETVYNAWSDDAREAALAARKQMKQAQETHVKAKEKLESLKLTHGAAKGQHENAKEKLRKQFDAAKEKADEHLDEHETHTAEARSEHIDQIPQIDSSPDVEHAAFGQQHMKVEGLLADHEGKGTDISHSERAAAAKEIHGESKKLRDMGAKLKGVEGSDDHYSGKDVSDMQGHLKGLTERTKGVVESAKAYKSARRVVRDIKQIATNQGVDVMSKKLSDGERKGIIDQITANCGCNAEDQKVLNGMSDAGLLRLKANAFPKKSEDDDDSYLEENDGMKGKAEGSNADVTGGGFGKREGEDNKGVGAERPGANRRHAPKLSAEDQEALSFARNQRDGAKRQYAATIVANIADETQRTAVYNRLMTMPLEDLQFQASYFPKVQAPVKPREMPAPSFLGNAGGPDGTQQQTVNHQDAELLLDEPTVNYADWSAENRKNNGGHGKFTGTTLAS